jgi:lysophospholipid acyltransferase (LPLAT)-like uncharacterized protein
MMVTMSFWNSIRWLLVGYLGKFAFWLWSKSVRLTVLGEGKYNALRDEGKAVVFLVWHGRIFIVPYFFRKRNIMPLISPSEDGEIPAQIMARWGYKIVRGSGSHAVIRAWNVMKRELKEGGEVIIVPDGPRGPARILKMGGIKLAHETGAFLVPFSFSSSRKKVISSWDSFLIARPFSRVVAIYGDPIAVDFSLDEEGLERERARIEKILCDLDVQADRHFD